MKALFKFLALALSALLCVFPSGCTEGQNGPSLASGTYICNTEDGVHSIVINGGSYELELGETSGQGEFEFSDGKLSFRLNGVLHLFEEKDGDLIYISGAPMFKGLVFKRKPVLDLKGDHVSISLSPVMSSVFTSRDQIVVEEILWLYDTAELVPTEEEQNVLETTSVYVTKDGQSVLSFSIDDKGILKAGDPFGDGQCYTVKSGALTREHLKNVYNYEDGSRMYGYLFPEGDMFVNDNGYLVFTDATDKTSYLEYLREEGAAVYEGSYSAAAVTETGYMIIDFNCPGRDGKGHYIGISCVDALQPKSLDPTALEKVTECAEAMGGKAVSVRELIPNGIYYAHDENAPTLFGVLTENEYPDGKSIALHTVAYHGGNACLVAAIDDDDHCLADIDGDGHCELLYESVGCTSGIFSIGISAMDCKGGLPLVEYHGYFTPENLSYFNGKFMGEKYVVRTGVKPMRWSVFTVKGESGGGIELVPEKDNALKIVKMSPSK